MSQYTQPRQVRLVKCAILSPGLYKRAQTAEDAKILQGYGFDITPYVQKIDMFESIFSNTLSGSITLLEDVGFIEYLPLVGVESLAIQFTIDTAGEETRTFSHVFRIVKVGEVAYPRYQWRLYTLTLASFEFVKSASSRICRRFTAPATEAVRDIMVKDLSIPAKRIAILDDTTDALDITIPNYTPLQAINFFTILAQTAKTKESNFLFFETLFSEAGEASGGGFHFTSISQLIERGLRTPADKRPTYMFLPDQVTATVPDDADARNALLRMHQEQSFDLLYDIAGGTLRSQMVHFDYLGRTKPQVDDSRYQDTFGKTTHLEKYPIYPDNFDLSVDQTVRTFTVPSNASSAASAFAKTNGATIAVQRLHESVILRARQMREIRHIQTVMELPGQPDLRAGSVVNINYPSSRELENNDDQPINASVFSSGTPYHSGPHLITSVRHMLVARGGNSMEYRMSIRANKDSLASPLIGFAGKS